MARDGAVPLYGTLCILLELLLQLLVMEDVYPQTQHVEVVLTSHSAGQVERLCFIVVPWPHREFDRNGIQLFRYHKG